MSFNPEGSIVFDTPESINMYRLLAMRSALGLEIRTGMKATRFAILPIVNRALDANYRTKKSAYAPLNEFIVAHGGPDRPLNFPSK